MGSQAADIDQVKKNLQAIYQPLNGVTFAGTYLGKHSMPQTGNDRYKIESNSISDTLKSISSSVINNYGKTLVWKGITGPEDSLLYTDYWLWVEPDVGQMPLEDFSYNFKIERCTPFHCESGSFSYGVSIKASIVESSTNSGVSPFQFG